jgi:hypothetical protein
LTINSSIRWLLPQISAALSSVYTLEQNWQGGLADRVQCATCTPPATATAHQFTIWIAFDE